MIIIVFLVQYGTSFFVKVGLNYYSLLFAVALYVFAQGKGKVSKILSCKPLMVVAKYSFEFYMVHELMLRIFRKVFAKVECFYPIKLVIIAIPALIFSIGLTVLLSRIKQKRYRGSGVKIQV